MRSSRPAFFLPSPRSCSLITLFGALPVYARIAELSPHGQGSIALLEQKLRRWRGKALVLCLLGFAATAFVITITVSAADATAHIVENPYLRDWRLSRVWLTSALIIGLGAVFVPGIEEAFWLAVSIVAAFMLVNIVVVVHGLTYIAAHPETLAGWRDALLRQQPNYAAALGAAVARRTGARWLTSRTAISARCSARSTTLPPSPSYVCRRVGAGRPAQREPPVAAKTL